MSPQARRFVADIRRVRSQQDLEVQRLELDIDPREIATAETQFASALQSGPAADIAVQPSTKNPQPPTPPAFVPTFVRFA